MSSRNLNSRRLSKSIDIPALICFFALLGIGWLTLFATVYEGGGIQEVFSISTEIGKQTIWLGLSIVAFIATFSIDWKFWSSFAYVFYGFSIFLLVAVLILGVEVKGAKSWFIISGYSFQPSELAKLGTCLAVASLFGSTQLNLKNDKHLLLGLGLVALPVFLILLQPDAGSAIIFSSFVFLFYRAGANPVYYVLSLSFISIVILTLIFGYPPVIMIILIAAIGVLLLSINNNFKYVANYLLIVLASYVFNRFGYGNFVFFGLSVLLIGLIVVTIRENKVRFLSITIVSSIISTLISLATQWSFTNLLRPHQQDRINVWLRPDLCDPRGSLYNIIQSKTAIGSGGLTGSGFLEGAMTKLNFVPEQTTDFIFCTIGEEQGFLGVMSVIVLFMLLLYRTIMMAERNRLDFIRYYMYGVAGFLFLHVFINIGMTLGIMPVIGIPLPFMSKGGSSLLVFCIMFGIIFKMDLVRNR